MKVVKMRVDFANFGVLITNIKLVFKSVLKSCLLFWLW